MPDRYNGKVFFVDAVTRVRSVCSGTVVKSTNRSVVWTAGHCVAGHRLGAQGQITGPAIFHDRWTFVPAYSPTRPLAPFGKWSAKRLFTTTAWTAHRDFSQDVGAAVVHPLKGIRLTRRVGAQGIAFNLDRNQSWSSFGYPAEGPRFDGLHQFRCNSKTDDIDPVVAGSPIRINCDMTGGSSGGGWIIDLRGRRGKVNGVNSFRPCAGPLDARGECQVRNPNEFFGPYFGDAAASLYNLAQAAQ